MNVWYNSMVKIVNMIIIGALARKLVTVAWLSRVKKHGKTTRSVMRSASAPRTSKRKKI